MFVNIKLELVVEKVFPALVLVDGEDFKSILIRYFRKENGLFMMNLGL